MKGNSRVQTDKTLFYLTIVLITVGVVFSFSLTSYISVQQEVSQFYFLKKQFIAAILAIFMMWLISRMNPEHGFTFLGFAFFGIFLFLMTIMHFLPAQYVTEVGGAKRWIKIPGISLAPVEFFKVGFVFFLAWSFSRKIQHDAQSLKEEMITFLPYVAAFGVVVYLIAIMQNDLGQVIVLGMTLAIMAFMAGTSARFFMLATFSAIIVFVVAIVTSEHRILRIKLWWSNIQDFILSLLPSSLADVLRVKDTIEPYQISNSLYAIKNGGFLGEGIGNGTIKLGFLTEVHTDFVLAGIAEEIGIIGLSIVIGLFFWMVFRIFRIANRLDNKMESLFVLGVGLIISFAFFINAFGITGITPIKGIAVPLLSYGGSSLLAHAMAIGMVLMLSKKVRL
jgi:cell division protein FtsW